MFNREENIFADYDSVWKNYNRHNGKNGGWYDLYKDPPDDWENRKKTNKPVVEFLAENGYKIKVLPDIKNVQEKYKIKWSNPDILINGWLSDIKEPEEMTSNAIKGRIKSAYEKQKLNRIVLNIPDRMPEEFIETAFKRWAGEKHSKKIFVIWIYEGKINNCII